MSCQPSYSPEAAFTRNRQIAARDLAALGDTALDVVPLDVVGIIGLDIGGETVEGALDGFLGGRVHHAGLSVVSYHIRIPQIPTREYARIAAHHLASS
jgi:hypothetical protein